MESGGRFLVTPFSLRMTGRGADPSLGVGKCLGTESKPDRPDHSAPYIPPDLFLFYIASLSTMRHASVSSKEVDDR